MNVKESGPSSVETKHLSILVVDDSVDSAEMLAMMLKLEGHDARTAYDGSQALSLVQSFTPDVAFLDLRMPEMSGYEVARRLRETPSLETVLVAMTGFGDEEERKRTEEAGFDHHLVKPAEPTVLNDILSECSSGRRGKDRQAPKNRRDVS